MPPLVKHPFPFIQTGTASSCPLDLIEAANYEAWISTLTEAQRHWLQANQFKGLPGECLALPSSTSLQIEAWVIGVDREDPLYCLGDLSDRLPSGDYHIRTPPPGWNFEKALLGFGLGAYRFCPFISEPRSKTVRIAVDPLHYQHLKTLLMTLYWVRDLINFPAESMGPTQLALQAEELAKQYQAQYHVFTGNELLEQGYPLIHAVGRASQEAPRFVEIEWGDPSHPRVSLVGKGVSFDTGGLNLKGAENMRLMKKDMGGAAHAMGLARLIMEAALPIHLQLLLPLVENAVDGQAFRPGDIFISRKGLSVEIGDTDAEGRLILADALTRAGEFKPQLILDFATLTGAARVALGPELPAFFTSEETLASAFLQHAEAVNDPIWRLPLYSGYKKWIRGKFSDLCNIGSTGQGGAITAALFLQCFVPGGVPWAHFDLMAYNACNQKGRPEGGEAMTLRALFEYLKEQYHAPSPT